MKRVTGPKKKTAKHDTITGCCGQVWNGEDALLQCEGCPTWHHFACERIPVSKKTTFFCLNCNDNAQPGKRQRSDDKQPAKRLPVDPAALRSTSTRTRTRSIKAPNKTNL